MITSLKHQIGISSCSVHHSLTRGDFKIEDLPKLCSKYGYELLEICDFHLASMDSKYLDDYKARFEDTGVTFFTLLKDSGDITHPDPDVRKTEIESVKRSIEIAARLGAKRIRVIAGDAEPTPDTLKISADAFLELADHGSSHGVRVITENWHRLLDTPEDVITLLKLTENNIGLKLDFGNWSGDRKYNDLAKIAPFAECTHVKANYLENGALDREDFNRCLNICDSAHFDGPHILIYAEGGDEWANLNKLQEIVRARI
jgi:sugar phosphate isomerase/epimerase